MITTSDLCALVCRLCIPAPCVESLDGLCGQLTVKPVICVWTDCCGLSTQTVPCREPGHCPRAPARFRFFSSAG